MPVLYPTLLPHPPSPSDYPFLRGLHTPLHKNPLLPSFWLTTLLIPVFRLHTLSGPATLAELLSPSPTTHLYLDVLYEHPPSPGSWWQRHKPVFRILRSLARVFVDGGGVTVAEYYSEAVRRIWGCIPGDSASAQGSGGSGCMGCSPESLAAEGDVLGCNGQSVEGLCVFEILRVMEIERLLREERVCVGRDAGRRWGRKCRVAAVPDEWGVTGFPMRRWDDPDVVVRRALALCLEGV
ncbi:hypothetical protein BJ508DRAFT_329543 [Ascobolus immersus RN42]|uniref:Uncharacterized protein n=1 Tax=Ascobolus immersus RN42 TaxID=1160509 RepID=A0A3N4HWC4_ASCIM|nr:hypothetical protein BJ508DRAFT_329543 [Ascobolus immersus RN42]